MRVFISHSIQDKDEYLLTLLSSELRSKGFSITLSDFMYPISSFTKININKSQLFIGIVTSDGFDLTRVLKERIHAETAGLPCILLVEDSIKQINPNIDGIIFNRYNPHDAIHQINQTLTNLQKTKAESNTWAWVLGGLALVALLNTLSDDD
ncbi:hypothetical protein [Fulvivirga lutimaris]|uniref:hypothetical protein n=1 Tax=Fulvivirga lutimaris TaxID=1819566 RepID=UPI0012BD46B7|nr:hypothetical protein [Fulvivirga lutimaris]MTI38274.1 hypothetical protein [Fulvivirga lutimaris]